MYNGKSGGGYWVGWARRNASYAHYFNYSEKEISKNGDEANCGVSWTVSDPAAGNIRDEYHCSKLSR